MNQRGLQSNTELIFQIPSPRQETIADLLFIGFSQLVPVAYQVESKPRPELIKGSQSIQGNLSSNLETGIRRKREMDLQNHVSNAII